MLEEHSKTKEEEKLKENFELLENVLNSIKSKTKMLESQTRFLKGFNTKLEILLRCFEAYSFEEAGDGAAERNITADDKISGISVCKSSTAGIKPSENKGSENAVNCREDEKQSNKKAKKGADDTASINVNCTDVIERVFEKNSAAKNLATVLFEIIQANEPISLDNLVKSIKTSKYKAIEIVNVLIKEKVILKSFEKGFVYRVNREH